MIANLDRQHQSTRKITFLTKEIQIPDGVSDAVVSETQKILNEYDSPLLKFGQQLTDCVASKGQFEKCANVSSLFEVRKCLKYNLDKLNSLINVI